MHRDMIAGHLRCFQRFAQDERMKLVYESLAEQFTNAQRWDSFIQAAWSVDNDYSRHREALKRAIEINSEIAQTAKKLANLLEQYPKTGLQGPGEFFHIPTLLEQSEHTGTHGERSFWESMRQIILGDLPKEADAENNDMVAALRYAWEKAPPVIALIKAIANAANNFTPEYDSNLIKSAISSRKYSIKSEYLRAFLSTLAKRDFEMTIPLLKIVAATAIIVLDSSEIDVSYDDVAKAKKSVLANFNNSDY